MAGARERRLRRVRALGDACEQLGEGHVGMVRHGAGGVRGAAEDLVDLGGGRLAQGALGVVDDGVGEALERGDEGVGEALELVLGDREGALQPRHGGRRGLPRGRLEHGGVREHHVGRVPVREPAVRSEGLLQHRRPLVLEVVRGVLQRAQHILDGGGEGAATGRCCLEGLVHAAGHVEDPLRERVQQRRRARHRRQRRLDELVRLAHEGQHEVLVLLSHVEAGDVDLEGVGQQRGHAVPYASRGLVHPGGVGVHGGLHLGHGAVDGVAGRGEGGPHQVVRLGGDVVHGARHAARDLAEVGERRLGLRPAVLQHRGLLEGALLRGAASARR
mmetsp:Transcript_7231/g.20555  ORF Transcript_7231/g.20555 Transcript_7231/m.20555 type:complete len:331 (+) Transcript_7231:136-1128(+)